MTDPTGNVFQGPEFHIRHACELEASSASMTEEAGEETAWAFLYLSPDAFVLVAIYICR